MASWQVALYRDGAQPELRIGDAERERAASLLTDHLTAGRLELAEFDERVHAAYAARTGRELRRLFDDLPGPLPTLEPARRSRQRLSRRTVLLALLVAALVIWLTAVVSFPPFLIIPVLWLVLRNRRRAMAVAGYRYRR